MSEQSNQMSVVAITTVAAERELYGLLGAAVEDHILTDTLITVDSLLAYVAEAIEATNPREHRAQS